ncbi:hypothetical protein W97_03592 [Coniosporium apollinis CBS 100218]|uniref:Uncharacterized protein n=1 Tax=Coniosporium apollinis (strain CBS 100218) TaxID=1168221 RepID=R7YRR5_CONA1|nr:uncharacterized protein W97_03592 [Coniosporium apollinis CBS 100218]EON64361.1 hypothetical protein W97_03592 [Coniosporium apollinis CBS 100218]
MCYFFLMVFKGCEHKVNMHHNCGYPIVETYEGVPCCNEVIWEKRKLAEPCLVCRRRAQQGADVRDVNSKTCNIHRNDVKVVKGGCETGRVVYGISALSTLALVAVDQIGQDVKAAGAPAGLQRHEGHKAILWFHSLILRGTIRIQQLQHWGKGARIDKIPTQQWPQRHKAHKTTLLFHNHIL